MNTYEITYWPPPAQTGSQAYASVVVTVQAVTYEIGEEVTIFIDDQRSVVFTVPNGLYPVIQRTATA